MAWLIALVAIPTVVALTLAGLWVTAAVQRAEAYGQVARLTALNQQLTGGIADQGGNSTLMTSVRALGSLSRMIDHASQQQAILAAALAENRFRPGALTALTTARARQASDLAAFRKSATTEESWALTQTLARPPARQAQAVEQRATAAGNGVLALGPRASLQWSAGMAYTVGWMRHAEQQLASWITADAQVQQRSAMRSAIVVGGAALAALALVLLGTILAARSMARRRRRPEATALEDAVAPLPISASATAADHEVPAEPLALVDVLRLAASEIDDHGRVILEVQHGVWVSGSAATDTVHLLAELLANATRFSAELAQVIVSGHALYGGGSLVTITDGGTGMSEEELTQLNWQLANPSRVDMAVARHMSLFGVAHLAAQHGITVTFSTPPDGGTTAEVYLPAALIWMDADPDGWPERAGEAHWAEADEEVDATVPDLAFSASRFASEPESPLEPDPLLEPEFLLDPETDAREPVSLLLGAPVLSLVPRTSTNATEAGPVDTELDDEPPIFASVRSGYLHAFGRGPLRFTEQQDGQSPAGWPGMPPALWGNDGNRAAAGPLEPGSPDPSEPPQHGQPGEVRGGAVDQESWSASAAESAEVARRQLASFQRGSHRARAVAQVSRGANQPGQDG